MKYVTKNEFLYPGDKSDDTMEGDISWHGLKSKVVPYGNERVFDFSHI